MLNRKLSVALSAALASFTFAMPALSDSAIDTTLIANDGSSEIRGQLLAVENGEYVIDARNLGIHRISVTLVQCQGPACPQLNTAPQLATKTLAANRS